jgi:hypothetical protein
MSDQLSTYCVATVIRDYDPPQEREASLGSFEEVFALLRASYSWFADLMAQLRAEDKVAGDVPIGGFGVCLRNRWGSVIEVGVGRDLWFLCRRIPAPSLCYSDRPELDGSLAFWLGGWHHTELSGEMLVSRSACLEAIRGFLESDEFQSYSQA